MIFMFLLFIFCFSNVFVRVWILVFNNVVFWMILLREEREVCMICINCMVLYFLSCMNDVIGDLLLVFVGVESFIWISWDFWVVIK